MAVTKFLLMLYFAELVVIECHTVYLSEERMQCIRRENCSHINQLTNPNRDSYQTRLFLNLIFCHIDPKTRQDYIKCVSPSRVERFFDKANLLPNYDSCGLETTEPKIDGGEATALDEYQWIVLLKYKNYRGQLSYGCHGNLINSRYVLTAAHCVDPKHTINSQGGNISSVVLGEYNITSKLDCIKSEFGEPDCADEIKELKVESYHIHPSFNNTGYFSNDIALIRMEHDVVFTDFIKPICLPPLNLISPFNEKLWITGWGNTAYLVMNKVKVKARFMLQKKKTCQINHNLSNTQFCAVSKDKARTCPGDSGGPLMMRRKIGKNVRYLLIGVDSLGFCGIGNSFSIYTQVSPYVEWIINTIYK